MRGSPPPALPPTPTGPANASPRPLTMSLSGMSDCSVSAVDAADSDHGADSAEFAESAESTVSVRSTVLVPAESV